MEMSEQTGQQQQNSKNELLTVQPTVHKAIKRSPELETQRLDLNIPFQFSSDKELEFVVKQ